jgi:glycosyltransferase involved in cell wall biosynthesis
MTKKIKALVIGPYPPPYSGPEMAIKMLLDSPLKDEVDLAFLSTNVRKHNVNKGRPGIAMLWAFIIFVTRLLKKLITTRPKVVYYFVTATKLGWLGRDVWCIAISRMFGAKVITHMRAGHFKNRLEHARKFEIAIIRWACHRVSWSLVQAPSLANQFEDLAPADRIAVCPNMIDVEKYKAVKPADYNSGEILFLGHLSEAKGYNELLKTIPEVSSEFPNATFKFAGAKLKKETNVLHNQATGEALPDENPEALYQDLIKGQFDTHYNYVGILDETAKIEALRQCDFLVLPSYSEGFSMAVLEAMSMGKPVVCTAVGAMRDFVITGENGEVIMPGDTAALSKAIKNLLSDSDYRNKIAAYNAAYVRENFSQEVIAKKLGEYMTSAVQSS